MTMEVIGGILLIGLLIYMCVIAFCEVIASDCYYKEEQARLQREIDKIRNGDKEGGNELFSIKRRFRHSFNRRIRKQNRRGFWEIYQDAHKVAKIP